MFCRMQCRTYRSGYWRSCMHWLYISKTPSRVQFLVICSKVFIFYNSCLITHNFFRDIYAEIVQIVVTICDRVLMLWPKTTSFVVVYTRALLMVGTFGAAIINDFKANMYYLRSLSETGVFVRRISLVFVQQITQPLPLLSRLIKMLQIKSSSIKRRCKPNQMFTITSPRSGVSM